MKKILLGIIIFVVIVAIIFSPYLLIIDFEKYSAVVLIIWVLSVAYYFRIKQRRNHYGEEDEEINGEEEMGEKDV